MGGFGRVLERIEEVQERLPRLTFDQPAYTPPQDRAQPVWAVEDRLTYLREQLRQRQFARERARQELEAEQQRIRSYLANEVGQTQRPTPQQIAFGQGIINTIDEYRRAPLFNAATKDPRLMEAYRKNVVYPAAEGEDSFYQPGFIQADPQAARHELKHAVYYEQMTPEQRQEFVTTVLGLAERNKFVADVVRGRAQNAPGAGIDPQHLYTYFDELAPSAMPKELRKFYDPNYIAQGSREQELRRALESDEFKQKLTGAFQVGEAYGRQFLGLTKEQSDAMVRYAQRFPDATAEEARAAVTTVGDRSGRPLHPEAARQILKGRETSVLESPVFQRYPGSQYVQRAGEAIGRRALDPTGLGEVIADKVGGPSSGDVGEAIGGALAPQTYGELALELIPGIGFGPDAVRLGRRIVAKAAESGVGIDGVRAWAKSDAGQSVIRALRSETGGGPVEGPISIPDSVKAIVTRRRGNAPVKSEEELQAAWEVLPPTYQKMIVAMSEAVLTPQERRLIVRAGRARQTAAAREALETTAGSTLERAQASRAALKGRIIPAIKPVAEKFEGKEIDELLGGIESSFARGEIIPQEFQNATDAMHLLLYGQRPLDPSRPLSLMPHEIKLLGRIFGPEFEAALPKTPQQLSLFQKAIDVANLPRAVIASFDISAPGRQGIVLAARNPKEWLGSMGPMFRAWGSDSGYERVIRNIQTHRRFEEAVTRDIGLTDVGGGALAEEPFASRLAHKIPIVKRSERAYSAYLNDLRMSVSDKGWSRLERTAQKHGWDAERLERAKDEWAGFVRHATGRGDVGALAEYTPTFNALFFSPRFVISRPQTVWDLVKPTADPAVRQMVGENLGAFFAGGVALLTGVAAAGAQVELDPRSTNFGKITLPKEGGGIQTIDFWGGFQPFARYAVQVATGKRKEQFTGEQVDINRTKTLGRFLRSKLSPLGALGYDVLIEGKTYEGEDVLAFPESASEMGTLERVMPLVVDDMIEAYKTGGITAALTAGGVSVLGGGVSTFEPSERQAKETKSAEIEEKLTKAGIPTNKVGPNTRRAISEAFKVETEPGDTLSDILTRVKERDRERVMRQQDVPAAEADRIIERAFYNFDPVQQWQSGYEEALLEFWRDNPDLLREALDAGLTRPSQEKGEILAR